MIVQQNKKWLVWCREKRQLSLNSAENWTYSYRAYNLKDHAVNWVFNWYIWYWRKWKVHAQPHKVQKVQVLCNCEMGLLRRIRTQYNTSKFTQTAQIISGKPDLLFIDGQIQRCKEYVYPVMIKNVLDIVLFSTLFAKEGRDT